MGWASPTGEEVFDMKHFEEEFRLEKISFGSTVFSTSKNWTGSTVSICEDFQPMNSFGD